MAILSLQQSSQKKISRIRKSDRLLHLTWCGLIPFLQLASWIALFPVIWGAWTPFWGTLARGQFTSCIFFQKSGLVYKKHEPNGWGVSYIFNYDSLWQISVALLCVTKFFVVANSVSISVLVTLSITIIYIYHMCIQWCCFCCWYRKTGG